MGVPTSEVGYTAAMPRREDHEVHKDMWGHWTKKKNVLDEIILHRVSKHRRAFYTKGRNLTPDLNGRIKR